MTTGYFDTPQSVYYNTPIPTSFAMVTPGNDVGRFEDQTGMAAVRRPKTKRMTVVAIISMIFNLLMAFAITWSVISYLNNKTRILVADDKSSGAVGLLTSHQCDVPLSSALCTACVDEDSALLWSGKAVKVRTGNKVLCCRKVDQSLIALSKEMRDVHERNRSPNSRIPPLHGFFDINATNHCDTGRLHLGHQTKVEVKETGTYKLFVSITTILNDTLCRQSTDNYIRVVLEHPNGGSVILMQKEWACPKDLPMGEDRLQPIELGDTFKLTKGSNVFLQVKDRCQIYAFRVSNQFGYMKI